LNLASVDQLCDSGDYLVIFSSSFCYVHDLQSQKLIGTGRKENGLYILDELKVSDTAAAAITTMSCFVFSFMIFNIHKSFRKFENL